MVYSVLDGSNNDSTSKHYILLLMQELFVVATCKLFSSTQLIC